MEKLRALGHPRVAIFCAWVLGFFAVFSTILSGASPYSYQIGYLLKTAGLSDLFHSHWFIFVLAVLFLNLLCFVIWNFPSLWRQFQSSAPPIQVQQMVATKQNKYFYTQFQTNLGREDFRDLIRKWSWFEVSGAHAIRDEGGLNELQLGVQKFSFCALMPVGVQLGFMLLILGYFLNAFFGFHGRIIADQGIRTDVIEAQTPVRDNWSVVSRFGKNFPGIYHFEYEIENRYMNIEHYPETKNIRKVSSLMDFYKDGSIFHTQELQQGSPIRVKGNSVFHLGMEDTGQLNLNLLVTDKVNDLRDQPISLAPRTLTEFNGFNLKVIEVTEGDENLGLAARMQYQEKGKATEEFWLFQKRHSYDQAHRKLSRFNFSIDPKKPQAPRLSGIFNFVKDPGIYVVASGAGLMLIALVMSLFFPFRRYWFVWAGGKIYVFGWSENQTIFRKRFEKVSQRWLNRLAQKDPTVKAIKFEVYEE
jgi:cytochrome c biogenesis protein